MTQFSSPEVKTNVKQGAIIGGWLCFFLGLLVMYISVWLFIIYGPLLVVALILSIVAMAQRRILLGIVLLLATLIVPPVFGLLLSAHRLNQIKLDVGQAMQQSASPAPQQPPQQEPGRGNPRPGLTPAAPNAEPPRLVPLLTENPGGGSSRAELPSTAPDASLPRLVPLSTEKVEAPPAFRWVAPPDFYTASAGQIGVWKALTVDTAGDPDSLSFSRDGTMFAYLRWTHGGAELVIRDWATREVRSTHDLGHLNNGNGRMGSCWSPDSHRVIVFDRGYEAHVVDLGLKRVIHLGRLEANNFGFTNIVWQADKVWLLSINDRNRELLGWEVDLDKLTAKKCVDFSTRYDRRPEAQVAYDKESERWHNLLPRPLKQGQFRIGVKDDNIMISDISGGYARKIGQGSPVLAPDASCVLLLGDRGIIALYLCVTPSRTQYTVSLSKEEDAAKLVTQLKALMAKGDRVFVQVHKGRINPLNQKIIGIEDKSYAGGARVMRVDGDSMQIGVTYDLGMAPGMVAAGAYRKQDSQWREEIRKEEVWGTLEEATAKVQAEAPPSTDRSPGKGNNKVITEMSGGEIDQLINLCIQGQKWRELEELLAGARKAYPTNPGYWLAEARMWALRQDEGKKIEAHAQAVNVAPLNPRAVRDYLLALQEAKRYDTILQAGLPYVDKEGFVGWVDAFRAAALAKLNRQDEAGKVFLKAIQTADPIHLPMFASQIRIAYGQANAPAKLDSWLAADQDGNWRVYLVLGLFYAEDKEAAKAVAALSKACELANDPTAKFLASRHLGATWYSIGKFVDTEKAYLDCLKIRGDDVQVLNNLAYLYTNDMKQPQKALPLAEKAAQQSPDNARVLDTYGWTLAKLDRLAEAEGALVRAVQLEAPLAVSRYHLGWIYEQTKRLDDALKQYRQGIEMDRTNKDDSLYWPLREAIDRVGKQLEPGSKSGDRQPSDQRPVASQPASMPPSQPTAVVAAIPKDLLLDLGDGVTMKLVLIPAGRLMMGSTAEEVASGSAQAPQPGATITRLGPLTLKLGLGPARKPPGGRQPNEATPGSNEIPQHEVTISRPYYMGIHEVTQEQYKQITGRNPSHFKGVLSPVEMVSWHDAVEFCKKASDRTGRTVSLPTEAQWEYACRAGSTTRFAFGDDASLLGEYAWYGTSTGLSPHPVGQKKPNDWGLYDMHGNAWEWCADWYALYADESSTDPTGPASGTYRVLRGGAVGPIGPPQNCRSATRLRNAPDTFGDSIGFRVVVAPN